MLFLKSFFQAMGPNMCQAQMSTSNKCHICKLSTHTLQHMLVECSFAQSFWRSFRTWWFIMTKVNLNLGRVSIVYRYFHPCKFKTITNFALLSAKYFIYGCFLNEEPLDFELYKLLLREKVLTELLIASKNNTITDFNKKWQPHFKKFHFWHGLIRLHFCHPFSYFYYFQF